MSSRGYRNFFKWGVGGTGVAYKYTNSIYLSYAFIKKTMSLLYPPMLFFIFIYMILLYKQRFSYRVTEFKVTEGTETIGIYLILLIKSLCPTLKRGFTLKNLRFW
jgi:hypothetical protein